MTIALAVIHDQAYNCGDRAKLFVNPPIELLSYRSMAETEAFPLQGQLDRKKVKTGDLFQAICELYDPFHACFIPFPLSVVAQARVWRGRTSPDEKQFENAIKALVEKGLDEGQVALLIAYCESAFRPIKAAELAFEELLPGMLFTRSTHWPPNSAGLVLLETDFLNQLKVLEGKFGRGWVHAAGSVSLNIHGCPPLVAPWIVGVTIKRWLTIKKVLDKEGEALAIDLASVLLGRPIRPEELRHWESLLNEVAVSLDNDSKVLLPGYLIDIGQRMRPNEMGWGTTVGTRWTPKDYFKSIPLDEAASTALATAIQKGWRRPAKTSFKRTQSAKLGCQSPPSSPPEQDFDFRSLTCLRCQETIPVLQLYEHLVASHGIEKYAVESFPHRKELRLRGTGEVLFRWEEV